MTGSTEDTQSPGGMSGHDPMLDTAANYRRFAAEVAAESPAYAAMAEAVASDEHMLAFLEDLPAHKRQPNLLFAATRYLLGTYADHTTLRQTLDERRAELAAIMLEKRTQTNEAARCATLLPALAELDEPLALLEVGASAGLTLLPDLYSYDYAGRLVPGSDPRAPTLRCRLHGEVPLPRRTPGVAWRAGIDLHPLDAAAADDAEWLECLIWPGKQDRHARLRSALDTARRHPVVVHPGDLVEDLARVAEHAPPEATLVVYHSAVLAYVPQETRRDFAAAIDEIDAVWLSNEAPGIVTVPEDRPCCDQHPGGFRLIRDGRRTLAGTDPHGTWVHWIS